jgi:hypothetical protein
MDNPSLFFPEGFFLRQEDLGRFRRIREALVRGRSSVVIHSERGALVEHYVDQLLASLRHHKELTVETYVPGSTENLLSRFNPLLASLSLAEARGLANVIPLPVRIWVIHDFDTLSTDEIELLARLVQDFPGARVMLLMIGYGVSQVPDRIRSILRKNLLIWCVEAPERQGLENLALEARHSGYLDELDALLRRAKLDPWAVAAAGEAATAAAASRGKGTAARASEEGPGTAPAVPLPVTASASASASSAAGTAASGSSTTGAAPIKVPGARAATADAASTAQPASSPRPVSDSDPYPDPGQWMPPPVRRVSGAAVAFSLLLVLSVPLLYWNLENETRAVVAMVAKQEAQRLQTTWMDWQASVTNWVRFGTSEAAEDGFAVTAVTAVDQPSAPGVSSALALAPVRTIADASRPTPPGQESPTNADEEGGAEDFALWDTQRPPLLLAAEAQQGRPGAAVVPDPVPALASVLVPVPGAGGAAVNIPEPVTFEATAEPVGSDWIQATGDGFLVDRLDDFGAVTMTAIPESGMRLAAVQTDVRPRPAPPRPLATPEEDPLAMDWLTRSLVDGAEHIRASAPDSWFVQTMAIVNQTYARTALGRNFASLPEGPQIAWVTRPRGSPYIAVLQGPFANRAQAFRFVQEAGPDADYWVRTQRELVESMDPL